MTRRLAAQQQQVVELTGLAAGALAEVVLLTDQTFCLLTLVHAELIHLVIGLHGQTEVAVRVVVLIARRAIRVKALSLTQLGPGVPG